MVVCFELLIAIFCSHTHTHDMHDGRTGCAEHIASLGSPATHTCADLVWFH